MVKKSETLGFLGKALEPIVRLMLRSGVTWREFSELSKAKFVEVATAEFGLRGRPTNASRVAILTGLDRRDVSKLRAAAPATQTEGYQSKASQVLEGWHHDPEFLDTRGKATPLAVDGEGPTFRELMRRYAPALPVVAMIKELKGAKAVKETADGRLRPLTRTYVPQGLPAERLRLWASVLSDVANTIEHNFTGDTGSPARFERRALNLHVDHRALPAFRRLLETEGQALLERIDDWLSAHQASHSDAGKGIRLGVGIYHIEDRKAGRHRALRRKQTPGVSR